MPITKNMIIQNFSERFLKIEKGKEITNFTDILDLPVGTLKDTSALDIEILVKNKIKTIRDLSLQKPESIEDLARTFNLDAGNLKKYFIASKLIARAWQKRSNYGKKTTMKIVVVGLDNAGKTTMIDMLSGKKLSEIINQSPTTMVNQVNLPSQDINIIAWDFGGQVQHREAYLQNPEEYFIGLDLVLFVIDMQDSTRYEEALKYFSQLLDIIIYLKEKPYFLFLMHKSDPELMGDPDFQINLEFVEEKIKNLMSKTKFGLEIVKSSIYSIFNAQPQIVGALKDMFKSNQVTDFNVVLLDAMMKFTNLITQVGNQMIEFHGQIQDQLTTLAAKISTPPKIDITPQIPQRKNETQHQKSGNSAPPIPQSIPILNKSPPSISERTEILNELKEMFKKKGLTQNTD